MKRYSTISPAEIDENAPHRSSAFNDYYFSITDPIGERQTVFIEGNDLQERFQSLKPSQTIRIGETGFGTGLTFLVACDQFLKHAPDNVRLQWVSTERFPMVKSQVTNAICDLPLNSNLKTLANELYQVWPQLIPTCHRRLFCAGRITLDLYFGDSTEVLSDLSGVIDAWCLDGFSPYRNPESWTPRLFQAIADHSHHHTTLSTFTAARVVRDGLSAVGFSVSKVRVLVANESDSWLASTKSQKPMVWAPKQHLGDTHRIAIVGGGLAGAWTAHALAQRGFPVTVFEQFSPASGASGNAQGITYAKLSIEATPNSLIQLQALAHLDRWFQLLPNDVWQHTGVLLLAQNQPQLAHQEKLLETLPDYYPLMLPVSKVDASSLCGQTLRYGGLHIPSRWLVKPKTLCGNVTQSSVDSSTALPPNYIS